MLCLHRPWNAWLPREILHYSAAGPWAADVGGWYNCLNFLVCLRKLFPKALCPKARPVVHPHTYPHPQPLVLEISLVFPPPSPLPFHLNVLPGLRRPWYTKLLSDSVTWLTVERFSRDGQLCVGGHSKDRAEQIKARDRQGTLLNRRPFQNSRAKPLWSLTTWRTYVKELYSSPIWSQVFWISTSV